MLSSAIQLIIYFEEFKALRKNYLSIIVIPVPVCVEIGNVRTSRMCSVTGWDPTIHGIRLPFSVRAFG